MGSIMAKTTLYGGGEGSNFYRSCSVQLRRRYWKTGGSVSRVLSKVVAPIDVRALSDVHGQFRAADRKTRKSWAQDERKLLC